MATVARQGVPAVDLLSLKPQLPQNSNIFISPSVIWDLNSHSDSTFMSSNSYSTFTSPTLADHLIFTNTDTYGPSRDNSYPTNIKTSKQAFDLGSVKDWMRWDDPGDAALSPTLEFFPELKEEVSSPTLTGLGLPSSCGMPKTIMNSVASLKDSAVFRNDQGSEEPPFQPPLRDSPRENLYSTPLSWSRPLPVEKLSLQQEARLRDIAMPPASQAKSSAYPRSPSSDDNNIGRKRKGSVDDDDEDDDSLFATVGSWSHPPVKKTAHNMIEKRYRTNLNDKIAALRDSVPSLRVISKNSSRTEEIEEDLQGLTPANKLNKATVLSKATEYIAHLEKCNEYLLRENSSLKSRVDAFEILVMSHSQQSMQHNDGPSQQQQRGSASNGMSGVYFQ